MSKIDNNPAFMKLTLCYIETKIKIKISKSWYILEVDKQKQGMGMEFVVGRVRKLQF